MQCPAHSGKRLQLGFMPKKVRTPLHGVGLQRGSKRGDIGSIDGAGLAECADGIGEDSDDDLVGRLMKDDGSDMEVEGP